VTWDNRDVHRPFGAGGRAQPGGTRFNRERSPAVPVEAFPAPRVREPGPAPLVGAKYERTDGPTAPVTLGDADATVFTAAGRPDAWMVSARAFPAIVTFTDRLNRETSTYLIPTDSSDTYFVSRERIVARNAIAGSNAVLGVLALWAAQDEPHGSE